MAFSRAHCTTNNACPPDVQFPYGHEEKPEPDGTLRMLGDSMPADTFTDPWASKEMADYLKSSAQP